MKTFIIDTNVILDSVDNIYKLSDNGANLIVIPEVVIDELDSKKSGFEEINFNARQFARLLEEGEITSKFNVENLHGFYVTLSNPLVCLLLLTKQSYDCEDGKPVALNIMNDRKILEVAKNYSDLYDSTSQFISLDVMCRTRALTLDLKTDYLHGKDKALDFNFHKTVELDLIPNLDNITITSIDPDHKPENYSYTIVEKETGRHFLGTIQNSKFVFLDDKLNNRNIKALNKEQLFFLSALLDPHYNLVACEARAGSGKTLLALTAAMELVKAKKFSRIIYIRNSIESTAKGEEVGFLPGLEEKFKIYNHPLYDTLRYIARVAIAKSNNNKSKANKSEVTDESIESLVAEYTSQFNIQTMWVGEMRGRTLSNAYVIVDEYQNCSSSTGQLILSRLDKDCKVVCIGSNRQIDNIYTNKYINALSGLLKAAQDSDHSIKLFACELTKVLRGPLVEFAEKIYSK
jgi:PhoH-like ATPase